jgi:hypothetical protein
MRRITVRTALLASAAASALILAACSETATPTAPVEELAAQQLTPPAAAAAPVTVTVRGSVVDAENRAVAGAHIECLGSVDCGGSQGEVSAEGHEHRYAITGDDGRYELRATGDSGTGFLMNANHRSYEQDWRQVEWPGDPACAADGDCTVTVNFTLRPTVDE